MASEPEVLGPPVATVAFPEVPTLANILEALEQHVWLARSDWIWTRVMPTYHRMTEEELWAVLTAVAKEWQV